MESIAFKNIGHNIKFFRKLRRLSQKEVAEHANVSLSYYKNVESKNEEPPSLSVLIKIATTLDVPLDFIVKDSGIQLFSDYTDCELLRRIQSYNGQDRNRLSHLLLDIYMITHNS